METLISCHILRPWGSHVPGHDPCPSQDLFLGVREALEYFAELLERLSSLKSAAQEMDPTNGAPMW